MRRFGVLLLTVFVVSSFGSILAAPQRRHVHNATIDVGHNHTTAVSTNVSYNTETKKYHNDSCRYSGCKNCVKISRPEAERRGGVACKVCGG